MLGAAEETVALSCQHQILSVLVVRRESESDQKLKKVVYLNERTHWVLGCYKLHLKSKNSFLSIAEEELRFYRVFFFTGTP